MRRFARSREGCLFDIAGSVGVALVVVLITMGQPGPLAIRPLWFWCEVAYWLWQNNLVRVDVLRMAEHVAIINTELARQRLQQFDPELTEEVSRSICEKVPR